MSIVSRAQGHLCGLLSVTQTAAWLPEKTSVSEEVGQHLSEPFALKTLLLHHRQLGTLSSGGFNRNRVELFQMKEFLPKRQKAHSFVCFNINISSADKSWKTLFVSCCLAHFVHS